MTKTIDVENLQQTLQDDERIALLRLKPAILRLFNEWENDFITRILTFDEAIEGVTVKAQAKRAAYADESDAAKLLVKYLHSQAYEHTLLTPAKATKALTELLYTDKKLATKKEAKERAEMLLAPILTIPESDKYSLVFAQEKAE